MADVDLIKTVRGLDQTGPGKDGENLKLLWSSLAASADGRFHAVEESSLRWLLKSMNGSSQDAETIRRFPLTWRILDGIFTRIPLFSLAKSLADRRFIPVLQQAVKDISRPVADAAAPTSKRKMSTTKRFSLDDLKVHDGCVCTAQALFCALQSLLHRIDDATMLSSHDRIGVEHIKSLFCTSAAEATAIASPLMTICDLLLMTDYRDDIEECEDWIKIISAMWDLHLQRSEDTVDVATHLFTPSAMLLNRLEDFFNTRTRGIDASLRTRWSFDLQRFMHRSLIFPSEAAFLNRKDLEVVTRGLDVSKAMINVSAVALYFLVSSASDKRARHDLRRGNAEWMKKVFQAVEQAIRGRPDRNTVVRTILDQAIQRSMPIGTDDLRSVCRNYALGAGETDWDLVAVVAKCEPGVFQSSQEGTDLLNEVSRRSIEKISEGYDIALKTIIGAIVLGFRTARDISGFLKLWFGQLCAIESGQPSYGSPWLDVSQIGDPKDRLEVFIEQEMSPYQLLEVLKWAERQPSHPQARCIFSQAIARGIHSEGFVDAVGTRLLNLVASVESTSTPTTALKWRVVSKTLSWSSPSERPAIWSSAKQQLSNILEMGPIKSPETFEAFKTCCQAWVSLVSDKDHINEPGMLVAKFTDRLAVEAAAVDALEGTQLSLCLGSDADFEFEDDLAYHKYLAWFLRGSCRLTRLYTETKGTLPSLLQDTMSTAGSHTATLKTFWETLLHNDVNINDPKLSKDLVDRLIGNLIESEKEKRWPGERGIMCIRLLSAVPLDVVGRPQREQVMAVLKRQTSKMLKSSKRVSPEDWKVVLGLAAKTMGRPTFYEGMVFSDLVEVADAMSDIKPDTQDKGQLLLELIERFFLLASTTIGQMVEHLEDRSIKYLKEGSDFVSTCESQIKQDKSTSLPPFHITLLKALFAELTRSPGCRNHQEFASLAQRARKTLAQCVAFTMKNLMGNKKTFSQQDTATDLSLFAAVDAAASVDGLAELANFKPSIVRKFEKRTQEALAMGSIKAWKAQAFLTTYLAGEVETSRPTTFEGLEGIPYRLRGDLLRERVEAVTQSLDAGGKSAYLRDLVDEYKQGCGTDGQVLAVEQVVNQLIEIPEWREKGDGFDLAAAHGALTTALTATRTPANSTHICRILYTLLERKPQAMGQWNVELTLSAVCALTSSTSERTNVPFAWMCKLVEAIIKKHRLRIEGHYHLLLATLQALLRNLITDQHQRGPGAADAKECLDHIYGRLITLVCEPTAGTVARMQQLGALDSATDTAKRSAGRHMYLLLMQYVKLQLETSVPRAALEALEPAMNSIFDITPPEGRKILNDAMDGSGRAILREMFKRYTKFGKWSGV